MRSHAACLVALQSIGLVDYFLPPGLADRFLEQLLLNLVFYIANQPGFTLVNLNLYLISKRGSNSNFCSISSSISRSVMAPSVDMVRLFSMASTPGTADTTRRRDSLRPGCQRLLAG